MYIKYVIKSIFCFKCTGVKFYNSSHILLFLLVLVDLYTSPERRLANMLVFRVWICFSV